jgi:hypothetical protein
LRSKKLYRSRDTKSSGFVLLGQYDGGDRWYVHLCPFAGVAGHPRTIALEDKSAISTRWEPASNPFARAMCPDL